MKNVSRFGLPLSEETTATTHKHLRVGRGSWGSGALMAFSVCALVHQWQDAVSETETDSFPYCSYTQLRPPQIRSDYPPHLHSWPVSMLTAQVWNSETTCDIVFMRTKAATLNKTSLCTQQATPYFVCSSSHCVGAIHNWRPPAGCLA